MAMEPLPLGFGDAMDAALFSSLWTFQDQGVVQPQQMAEEELKQSLLTMTAELEATKEELRRKDQAIAKLADLVRQVAKERDEALDKAQPQQMAEEELKQSLLTARAELEATKEELRRKDQGIAKLVDLMRQVAKERDEALDKAQHLALLAKQQQAAAAAAAHAHTQTPQAPALVTSSVTDSDCSLVSSPVDKLFFFF